MGKVELEKNVFDLAYKRNLQLLNIVLILGIGYIFTYVGALILDPEKILVYTFVLILLGAITVVFYKKINENLKKISNKIKNLV